MIVIDMEVEADELAQTVQNVEYSIEGLWFICDIVPSDPINYELSLKRKDNNNEETTAG